MKDQLSEYVELDRLSDPARTVSMVQTLDLRGARVARAHGIVCSVLVSPHVEDSPSSKCDNESAVTGEMIDLWCKHGAGMTAKLQGSYALIVVDATKRSRVSGLTVIRRRLWYPLRRGWSSSWRRCGAGKPPTTARIRR